MKQIYSFIGLPASGKGTQAEIFAKKQGFTSISIGNLVREAMSDKDNSDLIEIKNYYDKGRPVPDTIVFKLLEKKIGTLQDGVIFDNFPFNEEQSKWVEDYIATNSLPPLKIIYIKISPEEALKRIAKRMYCPTCGLTFKDGEAVCPKCGGKLVQRTDDNPKTLSQRMFEYQPNIDAILDIYGPKGQVIEINGQQTIEQVEAEIATKLT